MPVTLTVNPFRSTSTPACCEQQLRVITRGGGLDHGRSTLRVEPREQDSRLHLRARDRQLVRDPAQLPALDDERRVAVGRLDVRAELAQRRRDAFHRSSRERLVADQLEASRPARPGARRVAASAFPRSPRRSVRPPRVSPRSPRPRTRTTSMSGSSTSAPSARTACSVDSVSPERPKPVISVSPSPTAASSTARCEIDLSPGTTACPTSARAGSIFTRRPPARRRPRSPAPRAARPRGGRAPRP